MTLCGTCGERSVRYRSSGECIRCYQQRYYREGKALMLRKPRAPRRQPEWVTSGQKLCRLCSRTLPIARFGMQKNRVGGRDYLKPYTYCVDCRTWKNHEQAVLRSRQTTKRGRGWHGQTPDEALQWVFERHWERIA